MLKKRLTQFALCGAALLFGGVSMAADDLGVREKTAIDLMQSASALSIRDGAYLQARDALLTGTGSIKARLETWEAGMQQWMTGWNGILSLMELRDNIPYTSFEAALTTQLNLQATRLLDLTKQATQIKAQGADALAILGPVPKPAASSYPGAAPFATAIDSLGSREVELSAALTTMSTMADARSATLREVDTTSRIAIITRLRAALLARGRYPLDQTIQSVQQLLDAQRAVEPILAEATKLEQALDRQALNFQIIHARDTILVARQRCTAGQAAINVVTGASKYVTASRARLNQLCTAMENHHSSITGLGLPDADLVAAYIDTDKVALTSVCKTSARPPVNCERLATLAALDASDFQSMDANYLRFVEYGWAENLEAARRKGAGQ